MNKYKLKKALLLGALISTISSSKVYSSEVNFDEYLKEQIEYYKANEEELEKDVKKQEIIIKEGTKINRVLVGHDIQNDKQEYLDIVLIKGIGNASSNGDSNYTIDFGLEYETKGVIVGVKSNAEYPFAIAEYNEETNEIGSIIGWFKDKDVVSIIDIYSNTKERSVSKYLTKKDIFNIKLNERNKGIDNTPINNKFSIKIDYSNEEKNKMINNGYIIDSDKYISKIKTNKKSKVNATKDYKIKNN